MDIGISAVIALFSSSQLYYSYRQLLRERKSLEEYQSAKVYSPSMLYEKIAKSEIQRDWNQNYFNSKEFSTYAFVEGIVQSNLPLKSKINGKEIVYSEVYRKKIYSNDDFSDLNFIHRNNTEDPDVDISYRLDLKDLNTKHVCTVRRSFDVENFGATERVAERTQLRKLNFLDKVLVYAGKLLRLVEALKFSNISLSRGLHIGWTETEFGITVGSALTVYGKIVYNSDDQTFRIDTPLNFLYDKGILLDKVKEKISTISGKMCLWLIPLVFSGIFLASRILKKMDEFRRRKLQEIRDEQQKKKKAYIKAGEDCMCIVCLDRPRDIIFKPCLHFSLCGDCYTRTGDVCPICKKPITDILEVIFE